MKYELFKQKIERKSVCYLDANSDRYCWITPKTPLHHFSAIHDISDVICHECFLEQFTFLSILIMRRIIW